MSATELKLGREGREARMGQLIGINRRIERLECFLGSGSPLTWGPGGWQGLRKQEGWEIVGEVVPGNERVSGGI